MITKEQVEKFLSDFYIKVRVFGLRFRDDRTKNRTALADLGINARIRKRAVMSLEWRDYSDGPIRDNLNDYGEMWVFGKDVNDREVYIKISLGAPNSSTICISFHAAETPMPYPLK